LVYSLLLLQFVLGYPLLEHKSAGLLGRSSLSHAAAVGLFYSARRAHARNMGNRLAHVMSIDFNKIIIKVEFTHSRGLDLNNPKAVIKKH